MTQLIPRTLCRVFTQEELWNGNRESFANLWKWDPKKNVVRWSWVKYHQKRQSYLDAAESDELVHAQVLWLSSHAEATTWLAGLDPATGTSSGRDTL